MKGLVLNNNNIKLHVEAGNWEEAVRIGAGILVDQGCATQEYIENILTAIKEYGPYIIVADGFAMPHARPECGALGIGCSLITLKEAVRFDGDDTLVKVMICFSAVDNKSHLDILKLIVRMVEKGIIDELADAQTVENVLSLIEMM